MAEEPTLYPNREPELLDEELKEARRLGIRVVVAPSDDFDRLAALGELLIYVVLPPRTLVVCEASGFPAHHSILADGRPVLAAGEVSLSIYGGEKTVLSVNALSGHYRPDPRCLEIVRDLFEGLGFAVPDASLDT